MKQGNTPLCIVYTDYAAPIGAVIPHPIWSVTLAGCICDPALSFTMVFNSHETRTIA